MERNMFNADKSSMMPLGGELCAWFSMTVEFSSPGLAMFAIALMTVREKLKWTRKSEKNRFNF